MRALGLIVVFLAGCSGLSVERIGPKPSPGNKVILLLHGYGAPGDDLVGLAKELEPALPGATFLVPAAPHGVGLMGKSWVPDFRAATREEYTKRLVVEAQATRAQIWELVEDARSRGVACGDVFVGGFSQGGRMALEVAGHAPPDCTLGGVIVLSGGGLGELPFPFTRPAKMRALVAHGKSDAVVPPGAASQTVDKLTKAGVAVRFLPFEGAHTIPPAVRQAIGPFVKGP